MPKARQRKASRRKLQGARRVARLKKAQQYDLPRRVRRALKSNGMKARRRRPLGAGRKRVRGEKAPAQRRQK